MIKVYLSRSLKSLQLLIIFLFKNDRTPLHYVSRVGYSDTVELLLKQGACANAITKVTNKLWFLSGFWPIFATRTECPCVRKKEIFSRSGNFGHLVLEDFVVRIQFSLKMIAFLAIFWESQKVWLCFACMLPTSPSQYNPLSVFLWYHMCIIVDII